MTATFDARRGVLVFPALFPEVNTPAMAAELKDLVVQRSTRDQPSHKRIDGRRALNLINELFLALHTSYPDYLEEHFGMSTEWTWRDGHCLTGGHSGSGGHFWSGLCPGTGG